MARHICNKIEYQYLQNMLGNPDGQEFSGKNMLKCVKYYESMRNSFANVSDSSELPSGPMAVEMKHVIYRPLVLFLLTFDNIPI